MLSRSPLLNAGLPRKVALKFAAIENEANDLRYTGQGIHDEYLEAVREHRQAASDVEILKKGSGRPTVSLTLQGALATMETARDLLEKVTARRNNHSAAASEVRSLKSNIDRWLSSVQGRELREVLRPEVKPRKGESLSDAIERCRRRVRELRADAHRVRSAPIPSSEAKAFAEQYVAGLQEAGAPDLHMLIEAGVRRIEWPDGTHLIEGSTDGARGQFTREAAPAAVRLLAWAQPEVFVKALFRDIDREADDEHALSADERFKRQATIAADRFATECEEESLIEQLRATGTSIARRPDADPRAVLGLASDLPAPEDSF
jgi:hypothetical protein